MTTPPPCSGEWIPEKPVTEEMENMCIRVAKQAGVHFDVFIPKTYRVQILCGATNFLVKVKVGVDDKCLHVMLCRVMASDKVPEGSEPTETEEWDPSVTGVQYPKALSDPLIPFEVKH
ncbi:hypothetical protein R3I93_002603 [Phoxinus phoxinus]|uniref:Uncharacterized protein n=1 Tax=Phoxinus phoxinus TaxID=58324 RepID=A0AAN9HE82_9TELE